MSRLLSTIKRKVIFAFGLCAATMVAIAVFNAFSVSRMSADVDSIYAQNTLQLAKLSNVTIALLNSRATLRRLQATRLTADVDVFAPGIRADLKMADQEWASYYPAFVRGVRERELAAQLDALIGDNRRYAILAIDAFEVGDFDAGADAVNRGAQTAAALTRVLREDVALTLEHAKKALEASKSTASRINRLSIALVVASLLVATILSVAILRSLLGPLGKAVDIANEIASGKLQNRITVDSEDEIGQLLKAMKEMERQLRQRIYFDPLTSLPNRVLFNQRLKQATSGSGQDALVGVMMIDMDRFKGINDTLGHAVGDELLREAAGRLAGSVRPQDTMARFGGDEFVVLLPGMADRSALEGVAGAILAKLDQPFVLEGKEVFVTCSIGIALHPLDSAAAGDLLRYADSAMYQAKRAGGRTYRFYSKALTRDATTRLALESALRYAIEREELELHYQPKVSFGTNEVIGSEALLRWHKPGIGSIPPSKFVPIAEETGLISELGKWVLREACRAAAEWNAGNAGSAGRAAAHVVSVNLSARQFQSDDLVSVIEQTLKETGCRPEYLELEITESLLLVESDAVLAALSAFRALGLSIAIDDFGTGYSSLSYLGRFPIDTLKIDKSFVQEIAAHGRHTELVKAIISIGHCLGLQIVAEGVETIQQAQFLAANHCEFAQGFLYSKPLSKSDMASFPRRLEAGVQC